ncbi:YraN family protein [Roseimaritima multifibrata]|uniref:YraN family protein n=1 Tax=Roseimaritima multifibrata TaxID=1930274 RepID=UPI00119DFFCD
MKIRTKGWGDWLRESQGRYLDWRYGRVDPEAPLGRRGEQVAARYLRRKKYTVIAESERDRAGEIDLIALQHRQIVFVEVKTLASTRPGHPADRVDQTKQARLTRAALRFLKRHQLLEHPARFDVIAVWWPTGEPEPLKLQHYENAFEAQGDLQWFA